MYSMTGYGKGVAAANGRTVTVEVKTVNHRYLDWGLKLPKNFLFLEDSVKRTIGEAISRGHVDVFITYEQAAFVQYAYSCNEELAKSFLKAARDLNASLDGALQDDITLGYLAKLPDVMVKQQAAVDEEEVERELSSLTDAALKAALENLKAMRLREGEALKADISLKLDAIEASLQKIKSYAPGVVERYRAGLEERIKDVVDPSKIDAQRLATEVALYADHCCIDEEITRLGSHIAATRALLTANEPVGRKMDFLVQEFNRETNTIGSKANDLKVTQEVLALKNEIEKLREQAANIE